MRKLPDQVGSEVPPRRRVVERTFGGTTRRRVRDPDKRPGVSGAMIHPGLGALLFRRVAHP